MFWPGYKLQLGVADSGFPVAACVTAASVHDSMVAIPLEKITEQRIQSCYSLIDSAYDAKMLDSFIRSRERIPVIEPNTTQTALRLIRQKRNATKSALRSNAPIPT